MSQPLSLQRGRIDFLGSNRHAMKLVNYRLGKDAGRKAALEAAGSRRPTA